MTSNPRREARTSALLVVHDLYWWSMIFSEKPVSTFRDHALTRRALLQMLRESANVRRLVIGMRSERIDARPEFRAACAADFLQVGGLAPHVARGGMPPPCLREMPVGFLAAAVPGKPRAEAEMRVRERDLRGDGREPAPRRIAVERMSTGEHPVADRRQIMLLRGVARGLVLRRHGTRLAIHAAEIVGRAGDLGRADDDALLIDPDALRHVDHAVKLGDAMLGVDQAPIAGLRLLDPRPRMLRPARLLGDRHDHEITLLDGR